ncbi:MAG: cysteine desulfurase/selenocysteine lyase [Kiritimatiellia bacterium]|jgi:cysteine desulfurase/selenocysteine lyase
MTTSCATESVTELAPFPLAKVREDFPVLQRKVRGKDLVYLDSAATALKPRAVVNAVERYYLEESANVHRGVHYLSQKATESYEGTREKVRAFLNAQQAEEIVFTSGTTAAINTVAQGLAQQGVIRAGDEILISHMEHHSNIVPWQMLRDRTGCTLKVIPITDDGALDMDAYASLLGPRVKLVSIVQLSNSLGTVNPIKAITEQAHEHGALVLVDAAQSVACFPVDVRDLDCDFLAFSGHKLFGPTGVGVLYGKAALLEALPPMMGGGDMILSVSFEKTTYSQAPTKFEAGTGNIAGVIGLGAAVEYVRELGFEQIVRHERELLAYATQVLSSIPDVRIIGTAPVKAAVVSFLAGDIHAHDMGTLLDVEGIAVRTGHHCTQPVMDRFEVPATVRAAFSIYNTLEEIDQLAAGVIRAQEIMG